MRVSDFRDRMVELNQDISWTPEHIKDGQFGKWLSNARDWSISRNRYWGTPIPVWVSDDPAYPRVDVYGSLAELEADFGRVPTNEAGEPDLHRPYIDELTRPNPDDPTGASTMRRIPDVLDVWFDSGSMPFAQVHYPFENADWFEHHYPGDFIVEYIGQTRGWFYTLHVLATALFDRPAFRNVLCHGIVLGDDGRKASKSLRNFPDPAQMWTCTGPTPCAGSSCRARSCAAATSSSARRASATACARCCCRCGARTTSSRSTRMPRTRGGATPRRRSTPSAPRRSRRWTATSWRARVTWWPGPPSSWTPTTSRPPARASASTWTS